MFYVYILKSLKNNKTYTGFTGKKVEERLMEHNRGNNSWTRKNSPFKEIYYETFYCKDCAMKRELFLKSGYGNKIVKLLVKGLSNGE